MPVKDAGLYLNECIESIIAQSEKDWELIAVDDHSRDNSYAILQHYSKADSRISCLRNEGIGIIEALRTAYSLSKGELIHRMDADDIMPNRKLEILKQNLLSKGIGTVSTGKVKYFSNTGISDGYRKYENWLNQLCENNSHWSEIYKECVIPSPCWLVFRSDLELVEAFKPNRYPEDYDLVFRFYQYGMKVQASTELLHLWRDHADRTSRNHEHYASSSFFALKLHYFFQLDRDYKRKLVIWGAGTKGKQMAKLLKKRNEEFIWMSNNPNKNGKEIYETFLRNYTDLLRLEKPQIFITVAQKNAKKEINRFLHQLGLEEYKDFHYFR